MNIKKPHWIKSVALLKIVNFINSKGLYEDPISLKLFFHTHVKESTTE